MQNGLRDRLTYANVMSTLAVFLLLAGGGAYAAGKLKRNAVKSRHIAPNAVKGVDADEATFDRVPSAQTAGTAALANGVMPDAIGPGEVRNPTRSINLPLTALINTSDNGPLDFGPGDGTDPNFVDLSGPRMVLEWDDDSDGGGTNVADTESVGSTLVIPADYASDGTFVARISKDAHAGLTERFRGFVQQSTGGGASGFGVTVSTAASTSYDLGPGIAFTPGSAVYFQFQADESSGGFGISDAADNIVRLEGLEFQYKAAQ